ncbi:hypothetical protein GCM10007140_30480 [Priestia taiwanensis]|uniref:Uncharacterized protein n=1 Tax=Priestia taiwanensis TaxID=1347902 RepID=A0A917ETL0_9BACI|nr:hypothetical protein GCM10007140_30480 [Priestia taiwanensis]
MRSFASTQLLISYETEHVFAAIQLDGSFRRFIGVVNLIILLKWKYPTLIVARSFSRDKQTFFYTPK